MVALGIITQKLRLYMHVVSGVLLIMSVLADNICSRCMPSSGKELYEFLAVTKVDGLPPAPSRDALQGRASSAEGNLALAVNRQPWLPPGDS